MPSTSPLAELLGEELPPAVAELPAETQAELAGYLTAALKAQEVALESSVDSVLRAVPLPLRGVVKKVLLG